jgi:GAF domain-containing protein
MAVAALDHLQQLVQCGSAAVYQLKDDEAEPRILATIGTPPAALPTTHGADTDEEADVVLPLVGGDTQFGLLYAAFTPDQDLSPSQRVGVAAQIADRLAAALHAARISQTS